MTSCKMQKKKITKHKKCSRTQNQGSTDSAEEKKRNENMREEMEL